MVIVSTKKWGPVGWYFFHILSFTYPNNTNHIDEIKDKDDDIKTQNNIKKFYLDFFKIIKNVLPCLTCQFHYKKILKINSITEEKIKNRDDLIEWVLTTHNLVNMIIGKKKYSFERLNQLYITNNQLNINHKLLFRFLYYLVNAPINKTKQGKKNISKLFKILIEIFPCSICRQNIKICLPNYNYNYDYNKVLLNIIKHKH